MPDELPQLRLDILAQIFEQGPLAIVVTDLSGQIEYVNPTFLARTEYSYDEVIGCTPSILKSGLTDPAVYRNLWETITAGKVWRGELVNRTRTGREFVEGQVITPITDRAGQISHFVAIKEDLSPLKASEQDLQSSVRRHRMLSACNQSLVRSESEEQLLDEICRLLVDEGGYYYAWVGLADEPQAAEVRRLSCAGRPGAAPPKEPAPGSGLAAQAIRSVTALVHHTCEATAAPDAGYQSTLALPFADGAQGLFGVVQIYSETATDFGKAELGLLRELTEDLCFGLSSHRTRTALHESERRFRRMAEDSIAGIYMIQEGRFVYVNAHLAGIFGYSPEQLVGVPVLDVVAPEDRERVADNLRRRVDGDLDSLHYELIGLRSDQQRVQVEVFGARSTFRGQPAVVGTLLDVTERYATEAHMQLLTRAVDAASSGIAISDSEQPDNPFIYVNRAFEEITGYAAEQVIGRNGRFLLGRDRQQPELEKLKAALRSRQPAEVVLRNYHRNGSLFWNQFSVAPVKDDAGKTTHYISVIDDITEQKSYERQLEQLSNYDGLTGLANKNLLRDRIQQSLIHSQRSGNQMGLMVLDLDRFKMVNQSLGLVGSDGVLQDVARRIQGLAGTADTVARLGSDEFAWLLHDVGDEGQVALQARNLMAALAEPIRVGSDDLSLTASIGIALYPRDGDDVEALLGNAEAALFQAAEQRDCFRFYTPSMNELAREHLALELDLKRACSNDELVLFYQPKVCLQSGRITGAEALMRWQHPSRGLVPPNVFIPLAEETGLIGEMGRWALEESCHRIAALNSQLGCDLSIAVNLSARQFGDLSLIGHVRALLDAAGLAPQKLECELTESMLMEDPEKAFVLLEQLQKLGVRVALDDFGTGYSSLSYLKRFPIDTLKIDRSFVRDIPGDEHDMAIARAIIALAQSLNLHVVAEGVETDQQREYLAGEGCQTMQGFLFSRPLPLEQFEQLLRDQPPALLEGQD